MKNKTYYIMAAVAALFASAGYGRDHYINDFATRTSVKPMPAGQWYETSYVCPSSLAYAFATTNIACTALSPYGDLSKVQDGWTFSIAGEKRGSIDFWTRTDDGASNPFACFSSRTTSAAGQQVMAMHPLYNAFSNGTLRISIDARAPATVYGGYDGAFLRINPVSAAAMDSGGASYGYTPVTIGFSEDCKVMTPVGYDGHGSAMYSDARIPSSGSFDRTHWYRIVADIHLDSRTYSCSVYDMGTEQPSLSTPTPGSAYGTATGLTRPLTAETGPLTGLGLRMKYSTRYSLVNGAVSTTNCPCADNIRLWWNASDAATSFTDADLFYENDFSTRRIRTFAPTSKTASYAGELAMTNAETYAFWDVATKAAPGAGTNLVYSYSSNAKSFGRDDWRKIAPGCQPANVVATEEDGGNVLAALKRTGDGNAYFRGYHPIGMSISEGFVKLEYDFRTPSKWVVSPGSKKTFVGIGNDGIRSTSGTELIRIGYSANSDSKFYPYHLGYSGGNGVETGTPLATSTWYRVCVVADLENSTYDCNFYELGANSVTIGSDTPATPVFSLDDVPFRTGGTKPVTTLAINAYDFGLDFATAQLFDNVRIWKGTDGSAWDLVYENDFNKRVRYGIQTVQEASLLGDNVNGAGFDGWVRRGAGDAAMLIRNASNPYATIEGEGSFAHAVHTFGKPVVKGKVVVKADIRPPSRMTDCAGHPASIYVGGDEYAQGEVGTASGLRAFTDAVAGHFGFAVSGSSTILGYYSNAKMYAEDATGERLDSAELTGDALMKWYRFVATFDVDAHTWSVDVYDQGTEQPASGDANGSLVTSFTGLTFKYADPTGISAIGIAGGGTSGAAPLESDKKGVLFDNISVVGDELGFVLSFR